MAIYTSNQFKISLSVDGVTIDNKSWDKFSGAGHTADTQNYPVGGMQPSVALGGVSKRNQATVERAWDDTLIGVLNKLDGSVNGTATVSVTPLKNPGTKAGKQRSYGGVIREVTAPEQDSTSSNVSMLQVVLELNEAMTS